MQFSLLMSATLIALFSPSITFSQEVPKPDKCPSVDVIKQVGLNDIRLDANHLWVASNLNNKYGTDFNWTFVLGSDYKKVKDMNEARQRAMQELQTLTFQKGPIYEEGEYTGCFYETKEIKHSIALTPPLKFPSSVARY